MSRRYGLRVILVGLLAAPFSSIAIADLSPAVNQRFQQGLAYERLGRLEDAYTELQLAANLSAGNASIALTLGTIALRLNRFDEAQRSLEHSISLDANSCASYYLLALLYEKKDLKDRAVESWHRFLQLNSDTELHDVAEKHIQFLESNS